MNRFSASVCLLLLAILFSVPIHAQAVGPWRYDFRRGDHLIYRYAFQRQIEEDGTHSKVEAHFRSHVLVVSESNGRVGLGFQRDREAADLIEYRVKGKDKLPQESVAFQKRMRARPPRFSEAMVMSLSGESQFPWEVAREIPSHIVGAIHEVMNLPPGEVVQGQAWTGHDLGGLNAHWVGDEIVHGRACHHVEASSSGVSVKLSYWWSPEYGVLEKVVLDGTYGTFGGSAHEVIEMELESRSRGESLDDWLNSAEAREGALQALLLSPEAPVLGGQLSHVLESGDDKAQALTLAVARAHHISLPESALKKPRESPDDEVRGLADQTAERSKLELAAQDSTPLKFGTRLAEVPPTKEHGQIPYFLRIPLTYRADRPVPLLVYLSGGAGLAIDGVNTADDVLSKTEYLVLYPHAGDYWWKREFAQQFNEVLQTVLTEYNVDRDRIYLTGFSNGGTGALYFAGLWPQRFAAVVTLMGAGVCNQEVKAGLPNLANLPILLVHGENDPLITPDCSQKTYASLSEQSPSSKPELKILSGRAHDVTLDSDDGLALAFFKNKLRDPFPRNVKVTLSDQLAARGYWIEILHGQPGKSEATARIKPGNVIEIHSHDVKEVRLFLRRELFANGGDFRVEWNGKKVFNGPLRDARSAEAIPTDTSSANSTDPKLDGTDTRDLTLP